MQFMTDEQLRDRTEQERKNFESCKNHDGRVRCGWRLNRLELERSRRRSLGTCLIFNR